MRVLTVSFLLLGFLMSPLILGDEPKPKPKFPLGKETTVAEGPLDKEGYIDYETALNERLSKGVTPEKNANALLWKALGPRPEGGKGMPPEYFKYLGIDEPAAGGDYLVGLQRYLQDQPKLDEEGREAIYDQQNRASQRPWPAKDYPQVAGWIKLNEKPLAVAIEATKRAEYFNPLASWRTESGPGGLLGALLPNVQKCREIAALLAARAMLRVEEGKLDDAWQDLLACHRLGRLVARGATLIEALVGIAIDQIATNADLAYLENARLTAKQAQQRLKDLQGLPAMPGIADKIDLGERFMYLDSLQMIRRGGVGMLEGIAGGKAAKPTPEELKALEMIDWEPALRNGNKWYDRMVAAMRQKDRETRQKEFDKIESDLKEMKADLVGGGKLGPIVRLVLGGGAAKTAGKAIGDVLIGLLMPAVQKVQTAFDRSEQQQRNLHVAFALAAFRMDKGNYPEKLDALAPKYLAKVPGDVFSGKDLIYRPTKEGYLLYSVGANGKDDEGRWYNDDPPGDDPTVRMPLPELRPKK